MWYTFNPSLYKWTVLKILIHKIYMACARGKIAHGWKRQRWISGSGDQEQESPCTNDSCERTLTWQLVSSCRLDQCEASPAPDSRRLCKVPEDCSSLKAPAIPRVVTLHRCRLKNLFQPRIRDDLVNCSKQLMFFIRLLRRRSVTQTHSSPSLKKRVKFNFWLRESKYVSDFHFRLIHLRNWFSLT